ncbi:MAG: glutamine--fructose-6-phosphate transaminase (isomerizing) [Nitrospinota bacterium]
MCGIAAVVSARNVGSQLFRCIRNLEYRGYDSCGVAVQRNGRIEVRKNVGSVDEVNAKEHLAGVRGRVGVAHTRWATHGRVSPENAHPHLDSSGAFAVVHNGIISNHRELRERLEARGARFASETDTEVVAHLVAAHFAEAADVEEAFVRTLRELEGTFALALISSHTPDRVFGAKRESPLIIGLGNQTNFLGSDFNAFIEFTRSAVIMEDGEYTVLTKDAFMVRHIDSQEPVPKEAVEIAWDAEMSRRGGYPHYMLKEIYEQPQTVTSALNVESDLIDRLAALIAESRETFLVGVGTTHYVGQVGQYLFSELAGRFVPAVSADEFLHLARPGPEALVVAISQSGETYDTLSALRTARAAGARTAAIVNVMGSSMVRLVDLPILQGSGPEICVVSTKAALSQMVLLLLVASEVGVRVGHLPPDARDSHRRLLGDLPAILQGALNERSGLVHTFATENAGVSNWLYLGRGIYYPAALECALKMKEVTYHHAEGMSAGFLKHGTIAMIDERVRTVVLVPPRSQRTLYELTLSSVEEVRARGGWLLGLRFDDSEEDHILYQADIPLPSVSPLLAPFLHLLAGQLLAYFVGVALGREVDKPRALAKSVTVA